MLRKQKSKKYVGRKRVVVFPATAQSHGFNDLIDNYAGYATHRMFVRDGTMNGVPIKP